MGWSTSFEPMSQRRCGLGGVTVSSDQIQVAVDLLRVGEPAATRARRSDDLLEADSGGGRLPPSRRAGGGAWPRGANPRRQLGSVIERGDAGCLIWPL